MDITVGGPIPAHLPMGGDISLVHNERTALLASPLDRASGCLRAASFAAREANYLNSLESL